MKPRKIATIALALLTAGSAYSAYAMAGNIMQGSRQTLEEAIAWQAEHYDISFFDALEKEEYTVDGFDSYQLHVLLCKNPKAGNKYVILSHGHGDNRYGDLKYMRIYLDLGYHCIIYDLRGHGLNAPAFCTYGILEGKDLAALVQDTRQRYGSDIVLGLHGESLGAATTISALQYRPDVDFAVADCPFADISGVLRNGMKSAHIPGFVLDAVDHAAKVRYGYALSEMRPIDALSGNQVPILFIHGAEDTFISPENSRRLAQAAGGAPVRIVPGAGHAESVLTDPQLYRSYLEEFLPA